MRYYFPSLDFKELEIFLILLVFYLVYIRSRILRVMIFLDECRVFSDIGNNLRQVLIFCVITTAQILSLEIVIQGFSFQRLIPTSSVDLKHPSNKRVTLMSGHFYELICFNFYRTLSEKHKEIYTEKRIEINWQRELNLLFALLKGPFSNLNIN